jgi:hypothetical protein
MRFWLPSAALLGYFPCASTLTASRHQSEQVTTSPAGRSGRNSGSVASGWHRIELSPEGKERASLILPFPEAQHWAADATEWG